MTKPSVPAPTDSAIHLQKIEKRLEESEARITAEIASLRKALLAGEQTKKEEGNKPGLPQAQPEMLTPPAESPVESEAVAVTDKEAETTPAKHDAQAPASDAGGVTEPAQETATLSQAGDASTDENASAREKQAEPQAGDAPKASAEALYREAYEAYEAGKHEEAARLWNQLLEAQPASPLVPNSLYWLAEIDYDANRFNAALLGFQKVLAEHAASNKAPAALLKVGKCHEKLGQIEQALQSYQKLVEKYPKSEAAALAKSWM